MVSVDQVKLLESRVIKTIEFVDSVTEENILLKNKLEACQKRIDELEVLIQRFKEDQSKIEDSIVSALNRLNKFEDEMGRSISRAKAEAEAIPHNAAPEPIEQNGAVAPESAAYEAHEEMEPAGFVLKDKPYVPESPAAENGTAASLDIF